jgi:hypothetical protein
MATQNLLVVVLEGGSRPQLRRAIAQRGDGLPTVRVVAPARVGKLEWLATDEDRARAAADARALEAEWMLADEADVEAQSGDVDPVQAVEDALRGFPAEEILLLGGADEDGALEASLRGFGLPVTRIDGSLPLRPGDRFRARVRAVAAGRSKATPFVFFAGTNLFLLVLAVLISLVVLFVLWVR